MFFKTPLECEASAKFLGFDADPKKNKISKLDANVHALHITFENRRVCIPAFTRRIASWFGEAHSCLLWFTEFGFSWPSENLHLYYTVRKAYHDYRPLIEAPGHDFLSHEQAELITFLHLMIEFGWGGFLFGVANPTHLTISHDGWILLESSADLSQIIADVEKFDLPYKRVLGASDGKPIH